MARIKYPIGIQTFSEIRKEGYLYVDKTDFVWDLVNDYKYVFLSRPRRFGKSLLTSTLEAYFQGRRDLFAGLAIDSLETEWNSYPVLHLDLSPTSYSSEDHLLSRLRLILDRCEKEYGVSTPADWYPENRFSELIRLVADKTGEKLVILIDEYDKPLLATLHDDALHDRIRALLQGFYSVIKESDAYIKFVFITGVSKFAHVSIFSGFNNLEDISLLPKFNSICGITEKELADNFGQSIANFAADNGITSEEAHDMIKANYDGYHFSVKLTEDIYNPFSLINAFKTSIISDFWFSSGTPSFIPAILRKNAYPLNDVEGSRRTKNQLSNMAAPNHDIVPMLFQAGYLTIKGWMPVSQQYVLGFPNEEVRRGFWDSLSQFYVAQKPGNTVFDINLFIEDVEKGNPEGFMARLRSLFASIESEHEPNKEVHFRNMMIIVATMCGFRTHSEIHTAEGHCDMTIETSGYCYVFEFKINSTAEEALLQIKEKGYATKYEADPRKTFLIGANFSTKTRTLTDWIIEAM